MSWFLRLSGSKELLWREGGNQQGEDNRQHSEVQRRTRTAGGEKYKEIVKVGRKDHR